MSELEEELLEFAEASGLDVSDAYFEADRLVVGDVELGPEHLEHRRHAEGIAHGYALSPIVTSDYYKICISVDDTGSNSAMAWASHFENVVRRYNDANTGMKFQYETQSGGECSNSYYKIKVREYDLGGDTLARAKFPVRSGSSVKPGNLIKVANGSSGTKKTALHEVGHTLGLLHPRVNYGQYRVEGTSAISSAARDACLDDCNDLYQDCLSEQSTRLCISNRISCDNSCPGLSTYSSVMHQNGDGPSGNNNLSNLSFDDRRTLRKLYPASGGPF